MSPSARDQCQACPHLAVDHHFNGHNDIRATNRNNGTTTVRGDNGRGACSYSNPQVDQLVWGDEKAERCPCPGFKAAE